MLEVYTDNVFEYVGNVKNICKPHRHFTNFYSIRSGSVRWLPNKATCDFVVDGLNIYTKDHNKRKTACKKGTRYWSRL